tara:strand:+ start:111 stop:290 length:180 start_codon:yes stop_codon:yes gene_type:complete
MNCFKTCLIIRVISLLMLGELALSARGYMPILACYSVDKWGIEKRDCGRKKKFLRNVYK